DFRYVTRKCSRERTQTESVSSNPPSCAYMPLMSESCSPGIDIHCVGFSRPKSQLCASTIPSLTMSRRNAAQLIWRRNRVCVPASEKSSHPEKNLIGVEKSSLQISVSQLPFGTMPEPQLR